MKAHTITPAGDHMRRLLRAARQAAREANPAEHHQIVNTVEDVHAGHVTVSQARQQIGQIRRAQQQRRDQATLHVVTAGPQYPEASPSGEAAGRGVLADRQPWMPRVRRLRDAA